MPLLRKSVSGEEKDGGKLGKVALLQVLEYLLLMSSHVRIVPHRCTGVLGSRAEVVPVGMRDDDETAMVQRRSITSRLIKLENEHCRE